MALASGTKLGSYEIRSALEAGGMGEVYRASDSKLKRDVALKVLPEAFARDEQRMAIFKDSSADPLNQITKVTFVFNSLDELHRTLAPAKP